MFHIKRGNPEVSHAFVVLFPPFAKRCYRPGISPIAGKPLALEAVIDFVFLVAGCHLAGKRALVVFCPAAATRGAGEMVQEDLKLGPAGEFGLGGGLEPGQPPVVPQALLEPGAQFPDLSVRVIGAAAAVHTAGSQIVQNLPVIHPKPFLFS